MSTRTPTEGSERARTASRPLAGWIRCQRDRAGGRASDHPGWRSLTPAMSLAVFVVIGVLSIDADSSVRVGLALAAAVPLGAVASYLCARYWPGAARVQRSTPPPPRHGQAPGPMETVEMPSPVEHGPAEGV